MQYGFRSVHIPTPPPLHPSDRRFHRVPYVSWTTYLACLCVTVSKCTHGVCFRGVANFTLILQVCLTLRVTRVFTRHGCFTVDKSSWHDSLIISTGVRANPLFSSRISRRRAVLTRERDNPSDTTSVLTTSVRRVLLSRDFLCLRRKAFFKKRKNQLRVFRTRRHLLSTCVAQRSARRRVHRQL